MCAFRFYLPLLALAFASVSATAAPAENCSLKQLASLDLTDGPQNTAMVPATVNGANKFMVVATAATMSGIFSDAGAELGLQPSGPIAGDRAFVTKSGQRVNQLVHISQFGLGNMTGDNLTFLWMSHPNGLAAASGFLGQDILRKYDVDLDFGARKLRLFSPDHCDGRVVYWNATYDVIPAIIRDGGHLELTVTLDSKPLRAVIDTTLATTMISRDTANDLYGVASDSHDVQRIPGAQSTDLVQYRYRFKSLSFGGVEAPNPMIALLPDVEKARMQFEASPVFRGYIQLPSLIIGMDLLRKLHLYIAYREQKIYITAAGGGPATGPSTTASKN